MFVRLSKRQKYTQKVVAEKGKPSWMHICYSYRRGKTPSLMHICYYISLHIFEFIDVIWLRDWEIVRLESGGRFFLGITNDCGIWRWSLPVLDEGCVYDKDCVVSWVWRSLLPRCHKWLWYWRWSLPVLAIAQSSTLKQTANMMQRMTLYGLQVSPISQSCKTCLHVRRGLPSTKCTYVGNYSRLNCIFSCCSS